MPLYDDLVDKVSDIFGYEWDVKEGRVVPDISRLTSVNSAIEFKGTVLYADLVDSTSLVDSRDKTLASEIYKAYLYCAGRLIRANGGTITAYDGDRVMAIYTGNYKNTSAVTTALEINYAVGNIINPAIIKQYSGETFRTNHLIGIDYGVLWAVKTGVREDNDIVWVGRAADHAAKLTTLASDYTIYITKQVYNSMDGLKVSDTGSGVWEIATWEEMNRTIYKTNSYLEF